MGIVDWIKGKFVPTFQLNEDDVVVFLVGPSGSGKSSFINEVTKSSAVKVGTSLRPSTVAPQAIRCELTEDAKGALGAATRKFIVFVDTPSYHVDESTGREAEEKTKDWLSRSNSKSTLVGTIYMHRVETDPAWDPINKHLRLHCILSCDGSLHEDKIKLRRGALQEQLGELTLKKGRFRWDSSLHPHLFQRDNHEIAWQAVVALFSPTK